MGHAGCHGRDWDPASPGAEDVGEQIVVLTEPDDVGNQLLGRLSLAIAAGIDHDELRVLDAGVAIGDRPALIRLALLAWATPPS
jgi:hypothetical protein